MYTTYLCSRAHSAHAAGRPSATIGNRVACIQITMQSHAGSMAKHARDYIARRIALQLCFEMRSFMIIMFISSKRYPFLVNLYKNIC